MVETYTALVELLCAGLAGQVHSTAALRATAVVDDGRLITVNQDVCREISEMLDFAEFLLAKRDREKTEAWATLDKYAGRYDGAKWQREELYDRAGLR